MSQDPYRGTVAKEASGIVPREDERLFERRFFIEGLAHSSYLFGSAGEAAVVDPRRDVDEYIAVARAQGLRIVAVFETHPHADFVSGHVELAGKTGARIYISHHAHAQYEHVRVRDGDVIRIGALEVEVIETPGHSPDSVSYLVRKDGMPLSVFTGDTLFVGGVGRPDLRDAEAAPEELADALYDSLFGKLMRLPGATRVLPSHGAGSLCGKEISDAPESTIETEHHRNWALQLPNRSVFVTRMLAGLPERPEYFAHAVKMNLQGAPLLSSLQKVRPLPQSEIARLGRSGGAIVDIRTPDAFGKGHVKGSINVSLEMRQFATWVGFFVSPGRQIALVVEDPAEVPQVQLELARIGFDDVAGYIESRILTDTETLLQLSAGDFRQLRQRGLAPRLLDVRTSGEWEKFHIDRAIHIPLSALAREMGQLSRNDPLAVTCSAGYRSSIAASLLQASGFDQVQNIVGGMTAYREAELNAGSR